MAYLSEPLLTQAWIDLNQRIGKINIPLALWKSPQNPAKPFLDVYLKWDERLNAKYDDQGKIVRPFTLSELEQWSAALAQQQMTVGTLEAAYPQLMGESRVISTKKVEDEQIQGSLPWWYWPLRISAGVGAGYFIFRVLRPAEQTQSSGMRPAFAGLGLPPINAEGMTWNEWRYAAGKAKITDSAERKVLKRAWHEGEDPSDWRKYFSDKAYEASQQG